MRHRLSAPIIIDFNVTKNCNLKCSFCYASACENKDDEMTLSDIDYAFKQFNELNIHIIRISGGEPFMRKDIHEIIALTEKYNFTVCMNTNATLISDEQIELLADSKIASIGVSLDGYTELIHDDLRGVNGAFTSTTKCLVKLAKRLGTRLCTTYTISSKNCSIDCIEKTLDLNKSLGINKVSFQLLSPVGRGAEEPELIPKYDQWKNVFIWLTDYKLNNSNIKIDINPTNEADVFWEFYQPLIEYDKIHLLKDVWGQDINSKNGNYVSCVAGNVTTAIASNGDVYPCELMMSYPELCVGNILTTSFEEIWNDSIVLKQICNMKMSDIDGKCGSCDLEFCGAGCRAVSYAIKKRLDKDDIRCPLTNKG